mgnify:FL=1
MNIMKLFKTWNHIIIIMTHTYDIDGNKLRVYDNDTSPECLIGTIIVSWGLFCFFLYRMSI